jgi:hypothetical protein
MSNLAQTLWNVLPQKTQRDKTIILGSIEEVLNFCYVLYCKGFDTEGFTFNRDISDVLYEYLYCVSKLELNLMYHWFRTYVLTASVSRVLYTSTEVPSLQS